MLDPNLSSEEYLDRLEFKSDYYLNQDSIEDLAIRDDIDFLLFEDPEDYYANKGC